MTHAQQPQSSSPSAPLAFHVMAKPIGPVCNLDCRYCFYLEKTRLYQQDGAGHTWRMSEAVLEQYVRQYIQSQDVPEVAFAWQGGEPTLLGIEFFRKAVDLQRRYAGGKRITNAIQTNGTLLDDAWCAFLAENEFLVGVSIDGPRELHDGYRVDRHGRPTFDAVMRAVELLKKHRTQFNTLTVVHRANAQRPLEVYRFLTEIGSRFLQFIPLVERMAGGDGGEEAPAEQDLLARRGALGHQGRTLTLLSPGVPGEGKRVAGGGRTKGVWLAGPPVPGSDAADALVAPWSVEPRQYGEFLVRIFDQWVRQDVGQVFVQLFDVALARWMGMPPGLCVFAEQCGGAMALEHNGDLYACDHYVYPRYKLGNLLDTPLGELAALPEQRAFGQQKREALPQYCLQCPVRFACNGDCPKHRFARTPDGQPGLSYLCPGYRRFLQHIDPYMRTMADLLRAGQAPAQITQMLKHEEQREQQQVRWQNAGRNDPCPCGSGRKYKKCCMDRR